MGWLCKFKNWLCDEPVASQKHVATKQTPEFTEFQSEVINFAKSAALSDDAVIESDEITWRGQTLSFKITRIGSHLGADWVIGIRLNGVCIDSSKQLYSELRNVAIQHDLKQKREREVIMMEKLREVVGGVSA